MRNIIVIGVISAFLFAGGCRSGSKNPPAPKEKPNQYGYTPLKIKGLNRLIAPSDPPSKRIEIASKFKDFDFTITGDEKAIVYTNKGQFVIQLYGDKVPNTVKNFIKLAELGFYDSLRFHRYVPNFVIQGGDPLGNGMGGAGYTIPLEIDPDLHHIRGAVGMARARDPNSASSQFYIVLKDAPHLDGNYCVFGQVIKGMEVVDQLRQGDVIEKIEIVR